jgi:hypothetical protein
MPIQGSLLQADLLDRALKSRSRHISVHPVRSITMVHITQPDALDLLASMEGQQWRISQDRRSSDPHGYYFWRRAWDAKARAGLGEQPVPLTMFAERATHAPVIYGAQLHHHYYVGATGELVLMADQVLPDAAQKASSLGFRMQI